MDTVTQIQTEADVFRGLREAQRILDAVARSQLNDGPYHGDEFGDALKALAAKAAEVIERFEWLEKRHTAVFEGRLRP